MKLDPCLTPHAKLNSKWIHNLNVRAKSIQILEENIRANIHDFGFGKGFLYMKPKA